MSVYIATFHTHVSALLSAQTLQKHGVPARMMPVPRVLSPSCGTCVRFEAQTDCRGNMDKDVQGIYREDQSGYTPVWLEELC